MALFWLSLPIQYKLEEIFDEEYLLRGLFYNYGIDIKKSCYNLKSINLLKKMLGRKLREIKNIKNRNKKDFNSFDLLMKYVAKVIKHNYEFENFHIDHMYGVWYLENVLGVKNGSDS